MDECIEKGEEKIDTKYLQQQGKRKYRQDDINVCVTIICITIFSIIVTSIKIVLLDMNSPKYASLFGNNNTTAT